MDQKPSESLVEATYQAFTDAPHLNDGRYAGAKAALLAMARKVDAWDTIVRYAIEDQAGRAKGGRPAVPQNDNVTLSSYAKLSEQMGLTPTGSKALQQPVRGNAPQKVGPDEPEEAPDGGEADSTVDKAATITALRTRRAVPGAR